MQHDTERRDRRGCVRRPASFAFWFVRPEQEIRQGAWMMNLCAEGVAFLTLGHQTPAVGEVVELRDMHCDLPSLRELTTPVPPRGRVVRVEQADGPTRRVAIRLEAESSAHAGRAPVSADSTALDELGQWPSARGKLTSSPKVHQRARSGW